MIFLNIFLIKYFLGFKIFLKLRFFIKQLKGRYHKVKQSPNVILSIMQEEIQTKQRDEVERW